MKTPEVTILDEALWVFGYGSLIWRPAFQYVEKRLATVDGYERRFCQASHDHRGTPEAPGRVVTLAQSAGSVCAGFAYKLGDDADAVLEYLEVREQDGYTRVSVPLMFDHDEKSVGITWIAAEGNPSWRANESLEQVARLIATRRGPSGTNSEYLFELERALISIHIVDPYVEKLAKKVRDLL